jgi:glycosyltransferase involved in cell wall biosynthesis
MPTEIGVNPSLFKAFEGARSSSNGKLQLVFVGRLIPLKGCDLALHGAASLLRSGAAHFTFVGDGPQREALQELAKSLEIEGTVSFAGWLPHSDTLKVLQCADVLVFPSLREIGGGVVLEALSAGAVPVVADFGGPGDLVTPEIGYAVPMINDGEMIASIRSALQQLADNRTHLETLRKQGMAYARQKLTYDARARVITDVLLWAVGHGPKPELNTPTRPSGGGTGVAQSSARSVTVGR